MYQTIPTLPKITLWNRVTLFAKLNMFRLTMAMTTENWYGIRGKFFDDPTAPDGKRFIATLGGWRVIRVVLAEACQNKCEYCRRYTEYGDLHHVYGRGMGSGKREDRPVVWFGNEMVRMIVYLCRECHQKAVIKRWGSWSQDGNSIVRHDERSAAIAES